MNNYVNCKLCDNKIEASKLKNHYAIICEKCEEITCHMICDSCICSKCECCVSGICLKCFNNMNEFCLECFNYEQYKNDLNDSDESENESDNSY